MIFNWASGAVQESQNVVCSPVVKCCSSGVSECCVQSRGQVVQFGSLRMLCAVPWSSVAVRESQNAACSPVIKWCSLISKTNNIIIITQSIL